MICEKCQKQHATVHLTEIVNQEKKEAHLCEECARSSGVGIKFSFSISDILGGLMEGKESTSRISGVVIHGAIRDVDSIRSIGFTAHAKVVTPTAGEPKGFGEIGVPIKIGGVRVEPSDWILADDSGVMRIPKAKVVEIANRAQDVLEHENRIREEIRRKSTLSEVTELVKWEKQVVDKLDD